MIKIETIDSNPIMPSAKALLSARDIRPKKSLGQNFLCDPQAADAIVRHGGIGPDDTVVEIGAGTGALTVPTARVAARVYAVETDGRLIDLLAEAIADNRLENVSILNLDFMDVDLADIFDNAGRRLVIMGNLPYYLSSQILFRLIQERRFIKRAVLMFQRELAVRITAAPGNRDFGRLSVMLRHCADVRPLMRVRKELFFPRPKIDSAVIGIDFDHSLKTNEEDEALLFLIIKTAFAKRRKTIKNALTSGMPEPSPGLWEDVLRQTGINPEKRAETLDACDYLDICKYYKLLTNGQAAT